MDTMDETTVQSKKQTKNIPKLLWLIPVIILLVLALVYAGGCFYYGSHFLPNTTINGMDVSNMSVDGVQTVYAEQVEGYVLTLSERNDETETISGADISLEAQYNSDFDAILASQKATSWVTSLFISHEEEAENAVSYDEDALLEIISELNCMDESNWTASENATLGSYDSEEGFTLNEAVYGTTIIEENLISSIEEALNGVQETLDLSEAGCYEDPEYEADSEEAQAMLETANTYAGTTVTYTFDSQSEVVDGETISGWLSVDDDYNVTLDETAVAEYVATLADTYDTVGKSKTLASSWGETVTIEAGTYGWEIDQEATAAALISQIKSGEDYSGDVEYTQTAESHDGNDYGNTYIEINLSKQHLYLYVDGAQIVSTDFVSGNVSEGCATPTGAYFVAYKEADATLEGDDYSTPVDYWMPFINGVGLHDASWRSSFGGTIFLTNGSHGCVNLPSSAAKTIFENIEAGIAVLVYDPDGVQSQAVAVYKQAKKVMDLIDAIGEVTTDSEDAIKKARKAYNALSSTAQSYVSNYSTLEAAEEEFDELSESEKAVNKVIELIDKIGDVTADSGAAITKARNAYDALSKKEKKQVTNYKTLKKAEKAYAALTE